MMKKNDFLEETKIRNKIIINKIMLKFSNFWTSSVFTFTYKAVCNFSILYIPYLTGYFSLPRILYNLCFWNKNYLPFSHQHYEIIWNDKTVEVVFFQFAIFQFDYLAWNIYLFFLLDVFPSAFVCKRYYNRYRNIIITVTH